MSPQWDYNILRFTAVWVCRPTYPSSMPWGHTYVHACKHSVLLLTQRAQRSAVSVEPSAITLALSSGCQHGPLVQQPSQGGSDLRREARRGEESSMVVLHACTRICIYRHGDAWACMRQAGRNARMPMCPVTHSHAPSASADTEMHGHK
jgi:hypothetical protein